MTGMAKGSLQRTMVVYFLMLAFAALLIGTEFIYNVHGLQLRSELLQNFERLSAHEIQPDEAFLPILKLRNKAILMVALLLVVVLILVTMFIKNITGPLQHMIETSKRIAAGDLSQTVSIHTGNELAELANTVNELTSNLQEIILLSRDTCAAADRFAREVSRALSVEKAEQPAQVEHLQNEIHLLQSKTRFLSDVILSCKFYKIGK